MRLVMPEISVIIPTYNMANFIQEAIQSVLDQTFSDFEIVVVDDGGTDNTVDVVKAFKDPRIRYIYQENHGVSSARNSGIRASSGEFIAFLDSDDAWLPRSLEIKKELLDVHPDAALICSDIYLVNVSAGKAVSRFWHDILFYSSKSVARAAKQPVIELITRGCFIVPTTTVVRRSVFARVGYFDESLRTWEDWDMFVRIARSFPVLTIDLPLARKRLHTSELTGNLELI
jgi:glycosyltransferase involved in cell wall biosynthesis